MSTSVGSIRQDATMQYKEVRGLSRGLELLKALNRMPGGASSTSALARACGIHRTTAKRLLETLCREGVVRQGDLDGMYVLAEDVMHLSEGFQKFSWVGQVASPILHGSAKELRWPSDLATLDGSCMVMLDSTRRWSMLAPEPHIVGHTMHPLLTALGRAYLAACSDDDLQQLLEQFAQGNDKAGRLARDPEILERLIGETRERGYAINNGEWSRRPGFKAVAVAVPGNASPVAAINLIFPRNTVSEEELNEHYLPLLRQTAQRIGEARKNWLLSRHV